LIGSSGRASGLKRFWDPKIEEEGLTLPLKISPESKLEYLEGIKELNDVRRSSDVYQ